LGGFCAIDRLTKSQKESSITRQLRAVTQTFPPLQEFEFEVATVEIVESLRPVSIEVDELEQAEDEVEFPQEPIIPEISLIQLESFSFQVAKIRIVETQERKGIFGFGATPKQKKVEIIKIDRHRQGRKFVEQIAENINLEMVYVPSGEFLMGSSLEEASSLSRERPQHLVNVPAFLMGKYPITQAQYQAVMGTNPSRFKDKPDSASRPVETVSWEDAQEFCKKLSELTGREYKLPSEAQWEYACRAMPSPPAPLPKGEGGKKIYPPFHFGETISTELANYNGNYTYGIGVKGEYREETTPVDHFDIANAWGLCDMHGNVYEWCQDHWHSNYEGAPEDGSAWLTDDSDAPRVRRGGSWIFDPRFCRSACRDYFNPGVRNNFLGFRVSCSAPATLQHPTDQS